MSSKSIVKIFLMSFLILLSSCGQDGEAVAPSGGSALPTVKADCNGESCV